MGTLFDLVYELAYYISGHGYGHATRSCAVIEALLARAPTLRIDVVTDAPARLFRDVEGHGLRRRAVAVDVGLVQHDGIEVDHGATRQRLRRHLDELDRLASAEADALRSAGTRLVVADIAPVAFLAARRARVPAVAVANFAWDWIYAPYQDACPVYREAVERFAAAYKEATLLLRLPFSPEMETFPTREDAPLLVRKARRPAAAVWASLGLPDAPRERVLVSFGGFGLHGLDLDALAAMQDIDFIAFGPPAGSAPHNLNWIRSEAFYHPDLVNAVDAVVSKPGYGTVAEAVAHGTAFLYALRPEFREYRYLVEGLRRHVPAAGIELSDLRAGRWAQRLRPLLASRFYRPPARTDGAEFVADRLLRFLAC